MGDALLAPLAHRVGHRLRRGLHGLDRGAREEPTYFIVGAKRAGTTSFNEYLLHHPLVVRGLVEKGCRYYDVNYGKGRGWYARHLPPRRAFDRAERELGRRPVFGESSPYYAFHPDAAARIAADRPDARVFFLLRDPVLRAWSHHRYEVARGFEELGFLEALYAEEARLADPDPGRRAFSHRHHSYAARSAYAAQVRHLWSVFGQEPVALVESERLFAAPGPVMRAAFAHLGLGPPPEEAGAFVPHKALGPEEPPAEAAAWLRDRLADDMREVAAMLPTRPAWLP